MAFVFLFVFSLVPFVGPFFALLTPLPFLYYSTKLGPQEGLKMGLLAIALTSLGTVLAGSPQLVFLAVELGFLGLLISECFRRGCSFGLTVVIGTVVVLFFGLTILVSVGLTKDMGPLELVRSYFQTNLQGTMSAYQAEGWDQAKLRQFEEYAKILAGVIARIYPSLMIIGAGFLVWINVVLGIPLLRLRKLNYPDFGSLDRWRAPEHLVWALIVAGFSSFLPVGSVKFVGINVLLILLVVYGLQGLSIVLFYLNKYRVPSWIRIGIYLLFLLQQIFLVGLAMVGLFDQWIDFRKIHAKKQS
ncbi:MAG: YybS family protein [Deltaproteobacteria bacterium]|nr:YybS family protein [Deltaproteobacteria bacterium]